MDARVKNYTTLPKLGDTFRPEAFVRIAPSNKNHFPQNELLFCPPDGENPEVFFERYGKDPVSNVQLNLEIFEKAIDAHMRRQEPVSINLDPVALFDSQFMETLNRVFKRHPSISPQKICLEITERGGVPESFSEARLTHLKGLGFILALDDFDPRQKEEWARLEKFAPYIDIIKLPYQIMEEVRESTAVQAFKHIKTLKTEYPDLELIMEGFRVTDDCFVEILQEVGIHTVQRSPYGQPSLAPAL